MFYYFVWPIPWFPPLSCCLEYEELTTESLFLSLSLSLSFTLTLSLSLQFLRVFSDLSFSKNLLFRMNTIRTRVFFKFNLWWYDIFASYIFCILPAWIGTAHGLTFELLFPEKRVLMVPISPIFQVYESICF